MNTNYTPSTITISLTVEEAAAFLTDMDERHIPDLFTSYATDTLLQHLSIATHNAQTMKRLPESKESVEEWLTRTDDEYIKERIDQES